MIINGRLIVSLFFRLILLSVKVSRYLCRMMMMREDDTREETLWDEDDTGCFCYYWLLDCKTIIIWCYRFSQGWSWWWSWIQWLMKVWLTPFESMEEAVSFTTENKGCCSSCNWQTFVCQSLSEKTLIDKRHENEEGGIDVYYIQICLLQNVVKEKLAVRKTVRKRNTRLPGLLSWPDPCLLRDAVARKRRVNEPMREEQRVKYTWEKTRRGRGSKTGMSICEERTRGEREEETEKRETKPGKWEEPDSESTWKTEPRDKKYTVNDRIRSLQYKLKRSGQVFGHCYPCLLLLLLVSPFPFTSSFCFAPVSLPFSCLSSFPLRLLLSIRS